MDGKESSSVWSEMSGGREGKIKTHASRDTEIISPKSLLMPTCVALCVLVCLCACVRVCLLVMDIVVLLLDTVPVCAC